MRQIFTLVLLAMSVFAMAQEMKSLIETENLKGKVKTIKEIFYVPIKQDGKWVKTKSEAVINIGKYDEQGNAVEESGNLLGSIIGVKYSNQYDEKKNLVERIMMDKKGRGIKIVYQYDENNRLVNEKGSVQNMDYSYQKEYKYNDEGKNIELISYLNGKYKLKWDYTYDKKGNKIEAVEYNTNGKAYRKLMYKYNDKNDKVEILYEYNGSNDRKKGTYEYTKYDAKGNWTERIADFGDENFKIIEREIEYYD